MNYIEIEKNQEINLTAKKGATAKQAIISAIEFCKTNKTSGCYLEFFGFTFGIEPESNIVELFDDYNFWKSYQNDK